MIKVVYGICFVAFLVGLKIQDLVEEPTECKVENEKELQERAQRHGASMPGGIKMNRYTELTGK